MATVLQSRLLLTPLERVENAVLVIEDGIIVSVGSRDGITLPANARVVDFGNAILTPGLIDIHIHGAAGHDVMEGEDNSLAAVECLLARHGVTSYCPTTLTAPMDVTLASLEKLSAAVQKAKHTAYADRSRPLGIHLEGPFLSHARPGVHPPIDLQPASARVFEPIYEAGGGGICMLTIAPELPGALELIANASGRGICVSMGHSNADFVQALAGIEAGARHATHTFNAMRRMEHRDPGILGAILTDDAISADIIVDGQHVEPAMVDLFLRAKGVGHAVLVTDATSATGMPDGSYRLGSFEVQVKDGRCLSHGKLAGSILTLDRALQNVMSFAHLTFEQSVRLATLNPARVLGMEDCKGVLKPGADADVAVFSAKGEVQRTIIGAIME